MSAQLELQDRLVEVLRASGVFSLLDLSVQTELAKLMEIRHVPGGRMVLREGEDSDSMLFVLNGRLRVSRREKDGTLKLYNEIRVGECVGETGMILRQARTADVTALRDSTLALLLRADFELLLERFPVPMNRVFAQAIYNHLRHTPQVVEGRHAQTFAVVPLHPGAGAGEVARSMVRAFSAVGKTHLLSAVAERQHESRTADMRHSINRHQQLENEYDYLIYEAEVGITARTLRAFRQADQIVFVAAANASPSISEFERDLWQEPGVSMKRKHLVVLHPADTRSPTESGRWLPGRQLERVYLVRSGNLDDYARVGRFLTGTAVGVVLGGGGARGFAHLGVLKALEEEGIPIDIIGGNSMGALIGAQYACGWSLDEIREQTKVFASGGERPTLPVISLVSGKRVERDLRRMFGDTACDALWRPFFAAACNLSQACTTVQDSGPLWRAVLASNSPAGLFPPVLYRGDLLVDGAILENVPVGAMRQRLGTPLERRRGNGTLIAIDVDVRQELCVDPALEQLSRWRTIKGYFGARKGATPGIGDILYRAGHIGGLQQRPQVIADADHYLEPPVAEFPMMAYRRAAEIAGVGYTYAKDAISRWDRQSLPL